MGLFRGKSEIIFFLLIGEFNSFTFIVIILSCVKHTPSKIYIHIYSVYIIM